MVDPEIIYPFIEREVFAEERNVYYKPEFISTTEPSLPPEPMGEEDDGEEEDQGRGLCSD